jgi:hypothetical protein
VVINSLRSRGEVVIHGDQVAITTSSPLNHYFITRPKGAHHHLTTTSPQKDK